MIRVDHISKVFHNTHAVRDVSFEIKEGEIVGLLGPNGSGKTTTLRMSAGFFSPTSGHVFIGDSDLYASPHSLRMRIGYLPENVSLYDQLTVAEFLGYVADLKQVAPSVKKEQVEFLIAQCNLQTVQNRLIGKLSKGFRGRIGLAQALIGDPGILILDEPTSGLDPKQMAEVRALIKKLSKNKAVLFSSHLLSEVSQLCSRVLIMDQGALVASGTPGKYEELEEIFLNAISGEKRK